MEQARAAMDPSLFRQEFFGSIEARMGAVCLAFGQKNIRDVTDNGEPILFACDFKTSPFWHFCTRSSLCPSKADALSLVLCRTVPTASTVAQEDDHPRDRPPECDTQQD